MPACIGSVIHFVEMLAPPDRSVFGLRLLMVGLEVTQPFKNSELHKRHPRLSHLESRICQPEHSSHKIGRWRKSVEQLPAHVLLLAPDHL
jgi:hypothetical protein